ncbi:16S rRNA (uracil(1498)-N(3))-methyltransferase [Psychrosphaera aquimarina]|uniref:Ribosomal RNA small subunit methyltransferase E n=1 Tax=Psychrosphaera aquimarina TaxID=2044854 RepID=A0ABU3R4M7_9GAMM|nr:16S rRNA (uracil(1498)-N(3))-methyltransferase [Psychrosphaera aquimarina]MDU0114631.1 16S rRNA (uracil(1498)-N(3))-methyltransferase [Psychrosphaera aquimarina]
MRTSRIYHSSALSVNTRVNLEPEAANHVGRVLRMQMGQSIVLFNGDGNDYDAEITEVTKKNVVVNVLSQHPVTNESPLKVHLAQGISRGDKMDFTIQKSVELGITDITPIFTERCGVKLSGERLDKKHGQWQKIAIAACEQSGRATIPTIHKPIQITEFLTQQSDQLKLNLHPRASTTVKGLVVPDSGVRFIIGPEGGLNDHEIEQAVSAGYQEILLGPRILRTETAALTLLSALQLQFGDLA